MDVNDLKGLFAEVNKRMNAATDHVRHELSGVRTGRASVAILDSIHVEAYGSKMPLNQLAGLSIPEPSLIVAQPFDPSLLGAIEKAIRASDLGSESGQRRQARAHPDSLAHRRAPQGALASRPQTVRRGPQQRSADTPRRQRTAQEAAQGFHDLRRRREEGSRRSAENHRPARQAHRRAPEARKTPICSGASRRARTFVAHDVLQSSGMLRAVRGAGTRSA